ncbi:hypothetical protein HDU97_003897 [Phlyctochytrium planicorne]|nr:hypothetical protein HDU97_003897 [Phlyctochytrium planicorne]
MLDLPISSTIADLLDQKVRHQATTLRTLQSQHASRESELLDRLRSRDRELQDLKKRFEDLKVDKEREGAKWRTKMKEFKEREWRKCRDEVDRMGEKLRGVEFELFKERVEKRELEKKLQDVREWAVAVREREREVLRKEFEEARCNMVELVKMQCKE